MIATRTRGLRAVHCCAQAFLAVALFWVWLWFLMSILLEDSIVGLSYYCIYSVLVGFGILLEFLIAPGENVNLLQDDPVQASRMSIRQTITVTGLLLFFLVATKDGAISRTFFFSFIPLLTLVLFWFNRILPRYLAPLLFRGDHVHDTLLCGPADKVLKLSNWLQRKASYGIRIVGLLTDDEIDEETAGCPILGRIHDLEQVLQLTNARQLLLAEMPQLPGAAARCADLCDHLGVRLLVHSDLEQRFGRPVMMTEDDGLQLIGLHVEPLESPWNRILKRAEDLFVAILVVLFILPPAGVFVWILHRFQSSGPLLFCQRRTGLHCREFTIYKFRTMGVENDDEARQASPNDARIFGAGHWLRRLNIDELPQFLNVLKGEMSVVGPRPHLREHDEHFRTAMSKYRVRSFIKPGITGLAQVRGFRGETVTREDVVARVESDLRYVENWSFLLDWYIILKTAWQTISPANFRACRSRAQRSKSSSASKALSQSLRPAHSSASTK